jgi:HD-GYP domain-containing protein (c-di-GMP phosphodiesterase class II)
MPQLRPALDVAYNHHERWDGGGYPRGLKAEQIPITARVFAAADVWDALTVDRPWRKAWPIEQIRAHFEAEAGRQFDPKVVEVMLRIKEEGGGY